jgi:hypothetical protein
MTLILDIAESGNAVEALNPFIQMLCVISLRASLSAGSSSQSESLIRKNI